MIVTRSHLPRRTFLRGLGATLALPLLDGMVPALTALQRTAAKRAPRLAVFYLPNGMNMAKWTPGSSGSGFELSPILEPLAPYRDRLLVLSGMCSKEADAVPGEGGGDHSRGQAAFLTGVHAKKTQGADIRAGISMDQIAARSLGRETELASLELALEANDLVGGCEVGLACAYSGTIAWQVPLGDGPRDHPALAGLDLPPLGQRGRASPLLTKTLLFLPEGSKDMIAVPEGGGGRKFRAFDKATGDVLWTIELPAGATGAPMTYLAGGRQYIVVPIGERDHEGELVALALPQ